MGTPSGSPGRDVAGERASLLKLLPGVPTPRARKKMDGFWNPISPFISDTLRHMFCSPLWLSGSLADCFHLLLFKPFRPHRRATFLNVLVELMHSLSHYSLAWWMLPLYLPSRVTANYLPALAPCGTVACIFTQSHFKYESCFSFNRCISKMKPDTGSKEERNASKKRPAVSPEVLILITKIADSEWRVQGSPLTQPFIWVLSGLFKNLYCVKV